MHNDFWKKPFLMLQQNLRLIDAKGVSSTELAKQLIDEIEHYGGSATLANAGGIVAWYPTELSFQKPNEFLEGDFVGDILAEAHGRDMRVILRLDVSKQYDEQYEPHPDWFIHDRQGKPLMIIECKAPEVKISQDTFDQVARYNSVIRVPYLVVTNGLQHYCCLMDYGRQTYKYLEDIPDYKTMCGES